MKDLMPPSRVENAGDDPEAQASLRTLADVPARYRNYPGFERLAVDPAHEDRPIPKTIREAMSAVEAELSGAVKGPVTRSDAAYIDFYDGDGYPFDVKTPQQGGNSAQDAQGALSRNGQGQGAGAGTA